MKNFNLYIIKRLIISIDTHYTLYHIDDIFNVNLLIKLLDDYSSLLCKFLYNINEPIDIFIKYLNLKSSYIPFYYDKIKINNIKKSIIEEFKYHCMNKNDNIKYKYYKKIISNYYDQITFK